MGRSSQRWQPSYQRMSPRTDIPTCCPVSAVSSLLPQDPGWEFTLQYTGMQSLQGSQCLAPLLGEEGVLKWASVSIFLLETQDLKVEPGLSYHPQLLQEAAGEPSSGMGPSWRPKGDFGPSMVPPVASLMSLMIPALLSYPPANPADRQCSPLQGEGAWPSTEPHCWLCIWS